MSKTIRRFSKQTFVTPFVITVVNYSNTCYMGQIFDLLMRVLFLSEPNFSNHMMPYPAAKKIKTRMRVTVMVVVFSGPSLKATSKKSELSTAEVAFILLPPKSKKGCLSLILFAS
jgi:hypothetical protein